MPELQPFRALRYDPTRVRLDDVVAPPHERIGADRRAALAASHPYHTVRIDLPERPEGDDAHLAAARRLRAWIDEGVLVRDPVPTLTVYRMDHVDGTGRWRHTHGVVGAVRLNDPVTGRLLPHEATSPSDADDRLAVLRATRANLSPIWCLSPASQLTDAIAAAAVGPATAEWAVPDGTRHRLWRISDPDRIAAIAAPVATGPLIIADGHHRHETALRYRAERHAAGDGDGPWDLMMAYVVALDPDELTIRPIHRVLRGLDPGTDPLQALSPWFQAEGLDAALSPAALDERLAAEGAPALVTRDGRWLLRPRPEGPGRPSPFDADLLDAALLDAALPALDGVEVGYLEDTTAALEVVGSGDADATVVLRPVTIEQIQAIAQGGERLPPKTTYFSPKPSTGALFRLLE